MSECWIIVDGVDAPDNWRAMALVEETDVPLIVTSLSVGTADHAYRVEMVGATHPSGGSGTSPTVATVAFNKIALTEAEVTITKVRAELIANNKDLKTASVLFYRGLRYSDFLGGPISMAASILAFYQVVEACSRIVPWTQARNYDEQRAAVLTTLRNQLDAKSLVKKQAAAVTTANNALSRLDAKFISLRIEHAAKELGLGQHWIDRQRELGKLRNTRLGHPSKLPPPAQLSEWLTISEAEPLSAYGLAATIISAAIEYSKSL